ncbi:MAG: TfoX/Sxy family protein [Pseudomonadota bacterium]
MAVSADYAEFVRDLFSGLGPVRIKRMFGGAGVYLDDAMFALIYEEGLVYLRGDDELCPMFEAEGCERWVYTGKGKPVSMPYWRLPDAAFDDPDVALSWARRALVPAELAAAEKRAAKARKQSQRRG